MIDGKRMNRTRLARLALTCGFLAASFGGAAHAKVIEFVYDPDNTTVGFTSFTGFCAGCTPTVVKNPNVVSFGLSEIGSTFEISDFLTVAVDGILGSGFALGRGRATLEANIAFSAPTPAVSTNASADSNYVARFTRNFQYRQNGSIIWSSQPSNLVFGDGTEIALNFANGRDKCRGLGQCLSDNGLSIDIAAVTTLQKVPEPGVLALLGAGLVGVGLARRRRGNAPVPA